MPHIRLLDDITRDLPDGKVHSVTIGPHWTAVVVEVEGELCAGLASTFTSNQAELSSGESYLDYSALELTALTYQPRSIPTSIGAAAINALLPRRPESWQEVNAEKVIAEHGAGKQVVMVGHFPFTERLQQQVGSLVVLEKRPRPGDFPTEIAPEVIPQAELVAITGTTILNGTFQALLDLCSSSTTIILLGPSTFLSPVLFDYGVDILCGSVVVEIEAVIQVVREAKRYSQVHQAGVRLVAMKNLDYDL
jgi:uncharacterized protein (DUF4213/DUF364 family)